MNDTSRTKRFGIDFSGALDTSVPGVVTLRIFPNRQPVREAFAGFFPALYAADNDELILSLTLSMINSPTETPDAPDKG
jgi:hypothetical protein